MVSAILAERNSRAIWLWQSWESKASPTR